MSQPQFQNAKSILQSLHEDTRPVKLTDSGKKIKRGLEISKIPDP